MLITREDLYKTKYDYETLKANIYVVSLLDILKSQKLTEDFCVKYILNENYQLSDEEKSININTVKKYQKHLSDIQLERLINKKITGKRVDSVEDFETYMNRNL